MGKAGRWLRHFLPSGRKDRGNNKEKPPAPEPDHQASAAWPGTTATTTPASTPGAKEKRRWSFRRPAAVKEKAYGGGFLEPRVDPHPHAVAVAIATAAVAEAAMVAKQATAAAFRLSSKRGAVVGIEDAAAIKIQSVFRSYLARKALCALRGLVKLQALVRGHLVRRQASHTLRCMQALVAAQNRARVARLRLLEDDDDSKPPVLRRTPRTTPPRRSSPHHPRFRHRHQHQQEAEDNVKIVEVDTGIDGEAPYATPRTTASRRSSCYATPLCRTPSKNELYHHHHHHHHHHHQKTISPTPSALTDASARSLSGRYDDFSFATARNSPYHHHDFSSRQQHPLLVVPSYMANTESSRAKARSQSAPRQRHSVSSSSSAAAAATNEAPCWERQGSGRRRASLEGVAAQQRVQRCPSQASAPPWGGRMVDRWSAAAHDSDCGSTSTVITAATTTYCWSMATDNTGIA